MDCVWQCNELKTSVGEVLFGRSCNVSTLKLHRHIQEMLSHGYHNQVYNCIKDVIQLYLEINVRSHILKNWNHNFLAVLNQTWITYRMSIVLLSKLFEPIRMYIKKENLENIFNMGIILFRDMIVRYPCIHHHIRSTLLNIVMLDRSGENISQVEIKDACRMLIDLGLSNRYVYEEDFETPFLQLSACYYKMKAFEYSIEQNAYAYLTKAMNHLEMEKSRAEKYLDNGTIIEIVHVVQDELITKCAETIVEMKVGGVADLLRRHQTDELACMYKLFKSLECDKGSQILVEHTIEYLRAYGIRLIDNDQVLTDPRAFIQILLSLKKLFDNFLHKSFYGDEIFRKKIYSIFTELLALCPSSEEYLSIFIDRTLKNINMNYYEIFDTINESMVLYKNLTETDIFERSYKINLARRMILNRSVSKELERKVISKLRIECVSNNFPLMLDGMLDDMIAAKGIMKEFKECSDVVNSKLFHRFNLTVGILKFGVLPLQIPQICNIPQQLQVAYDKFKAFYLSKYPWRTLTLQPQMGTAYITARFFGHTHRKHSIQVTTYQMCILMLFNDCKRLTFVEIQKETNIPEEYLKRTIRAMSTGKKEQRLLIRTSTTKEIEAANEFIVNEGFISDSFSVTIKGCPKNSKETSQEDEHLSELETKIKLIMKEKKIMDVNELICDVKMQFRGRFLPSPCAIKRKIYDLIQSKQLVDNIDSENIHIYLPYV